MGNMSETLTEARKRYTSFVNANGQKSYHCGDETARMLENLTPAEVATITDIIFNKPSGYHAKKYAHLNQGQVRLNCGNLIRSKWNIIKQRSNPNE